MNPSTHQSTKRAGPALLALGFCLATSASAAPPALSPYLTDTQRSYVEDATSRDIGQVNMIACFMAAMKPDALVNTEPYIALVDETKCDPETRSSSANSGATNEGAQAASYMSATVHSTRASNQDPMRVKVWVDEEEEGHEATIFVNVSASEAPSNQNPYGIFRLDFCGKAAGMNECLMNGYLEGRADGINFYQHEGDEGEGRNHTTALKLSASGTSSGSGKLHSIETEGNQTRDTVFSFAYDQHYFLRGDECFTRDASDPDTGLSVWRYGLYDPTTGERITRNSGFPIEYTHQGTQYHGYLGYYGLSLPPEAANTLENGATVQKVDYSGGGQPTRTDYQVVRAGGKLTKYTKRERTLREMDQIRFNTYLGQEAADLFPGAVPHSNYELHWNDATGRFVITGRMNCGENGCHNEEFPVDQQPSVAHTHFIPRGGLHGWSQALGGELFINLHAAGETLDSNLVIVVYRTQSLVYPSELPQQLYCVQNCPTAQSLADYFGSPAQNAPPSPYTQASFNNWSPTPGVNLVVYGSDAASATLRDAVNAPVIYTVAEGYRRYPQYRWGVRSGRLFANLADAQCEAPHGESGTFYCDWKVSSAEVYYQWETGPNPWNHFAAVKDGNGSFLEFDAPLQVNFQIPDQARYGQYRNRSIVLQYGGFGELWGIPGRCVSRLTNEPVGCENTHSRYVPAFVIPFDEATGRVTDGNRAYLVKWLEREIRFARKNASVCSNAGLTAPANMALPTAADLKDPSDPGSDIYIGTKPSVGDVPRVIHGEVKF